MKALATLLFALVLAFAGVASFAAGFHYGYGQGYDHAKVMARR